MLADHARLIFDAAIDAVRGDVLMRQVVTCDDETLWLGDAPLDVSGIDRIILVGAGKASAAMARGLVDAIAGRIDVVGHVNVIDGQDGLAGPSVRLAAVRPIGVNEPTPAAIAGTREIVRWLRSATPRDLCVALISGGGSALLCDPAGTLTLDDQLAAIRHLSGAGCDIVGLNTVRKHLCRVKGGGLADACEQSRLITLVLSDVLGDPLDLIASGPTVADPSTPADALDVLAKFDPDRVCPRAIDHHLRRIAAEVRRPFPHDRVRTIVVGNNAVAVDAAGIRAESLGYNHVMRGAKSCDGQAEEVGRALADQTVDMLIRDPAAHRQDALITGGEPVVTLADPSVRGRGGRNQQLILAAYEQLLRRGLSDDMWSRLTILSGGTDGEDGPTDAAGAFIDARVHAAAIAAGLNVEHHLRTNDAYAFFDACGGLVHTGPTGTNVCDVRVALVDSRGPSG